MIGNLPSSWELVSLGSVLTRITYGFTNPMPTTSDGPYMVTAKDVRDGRIDYVTARHTSQEAYDTLLTNKSRPRRGDILLTKDGSIGRVAVCDRDDVCINQSVALLQPSESVDSAFLAYLLQAPLYQALMAADADGSTIKHIYITRVDKMHIALPPLDEQRAIAETLRALDDKVAANGRLVILADQLAATLTTAASSTRTVALTSVADVTMGSSPPGTSYNEDADGLPFYQGVRDFGVRFPENRVWTTAPVRLARPGDTLVSVRAPVGRTNLTNEEMCIGRGVAGLRSRVDRPYTLFHQVRLADEAWAPYEAEGTIFGSISKKQLEATELFAISEDQSEELEGRLASIERRIRAALMENRKLTGTRNELLPLLMSGRIRVRDAEKVVEEVV